MTKLPDISIVTKVLNDAVQTDQPDPTMDVQVDTVGEPDGDDQQTFKVTITGRMHYEMIPVLQASIEANAV